MKKFLLLCSIAVFSSAMAQVATVPGSYVDGEILVQVAVSSELPKVVENLQDVNGVHTGLTIVEEVSKPVNIWLLKFNHLAISHASMIAALYSDPSVRVAQNNHYVQVRSTVPGDPSFGNQWHHIDASDNDIDSDLAWDVTTGGTTANGDEIVVCVIEGGGSDWDHPDLLANHWVNTLEIDGNSIDDDGNGYVDDYDGWNSGSNTDVIMAGSHGTQVSGMIGAVGDNGNNVAGINWNVKIMQVDMAGTLSEANVIAAYTYPLTMRELYTSSGGTEGAFVVATNASWGIDNADPADYPLWCNFYNTLGQAGILNCGATANNNVNIDAVGDMPTACSSPYMISVTATNNSDVRTFSGYGQTTIDLGAPGEDVVTTSNGGGNGATSGTSFASPLTAGVIALLYSINCQDLADLAMSDPEAAANQVRTALLDGVDPVSNLTTETVTGGRLNAYNSVVLIQTGCGIPICDADVTTASANATCPGGCDGEITVTVTGGSGSFTYDIGAGPQASNVFTGVCQGDHTITVDDGALCNIEVMETVGAPAGMSGGVGLTHETTGNDGAINFSVVGGTPPYTYDWTGTGGFTATTQDVSGLSEGVYHVTVTDGNGCTYTMSDITITSHVSIDENGILYSIFPNPATDELTLVLPQGETVTLAVYDGIGKLVFAQSVNQTMTADISALAKGVYIYSLTDATGKQAIGKLVVQ